MAHPTSEHSPCRRPSRREFGRAVAVGVASVATSVACRTGSASSAGQSTAALRPLPAVATKTSMAFGRRVAPLQHGQASVYVPAGASTQRVPLILLLHGAHGSGEEMLDRLLEGSGAPTAAVLAPTAQGETWDALIPERDTLLDGWSGPGSRGRFGRDIALLDEALALCASQVAIDVWRSGIVGFSDGATYALAVGLASGSLFRRIAALSPGLLIADDAMGRPAVYVAHGLRDRVFPIERCGRRIANDLRLRGCDVTFREFDGGHELPRAVYRDAVSWATGA